jgi:hypothetical protein
LHSSLDVLGVDRLGLEDGCGEEGVVGERVGLSGEPGSTGSWLTTPARRESVDGSLTRMRGAPEPVDGLVVDDAARREPVDVSLARLRGAPEPVDGLGPVRSR